MDRSTKEPTKKPGLNLTVGIESIYINSAPNSALGDVKKAVHHDIFVCVSEVQQNQARLTVSTPYGLRYWFVRTESGDFLQDKAAYAMANGSSLIIGRIAGQSFILRKKTDVSAHEAIKSLNRIGIVIRVVDSPGSSTRVLIHSDKGVWDIVRSEITVLQHGSMVESRIKHG